MIKNKNENEIKDSNSQIKGRYRMSIQYDIWPSPISETVDS